jgi:site-specific DNA-methyltransferase (adenine-specific)
MSESKKKLRSRKFNVIPCEPENVFIPQVQRQDVLTNMLANLHLNSKDLFNLIMKENKESDERRQGWIFETLCIILIVLKCVNINYSEICEGQLQNLKKITNINTLLKIKVDGGGNNPADMVIKQGSTLVAFSCKYRNKFCETDVSKIDNTIKATTIPDYKIGLCVKDKELIIKHKYKNVLSIDKQLHDKIIENELLLDEHDMIRGLDVFRQQFSSNSLDIDNFMEMINSEYLLSPRQRLIKKLHQKMTELNFINSFLTNKHKMWCIAHKMRSGKSITMLLICKYLLEHGYTKILIMTSVPATIDSFTKDLEKYIDFKNIKYVVQDELDTLNKDFKGIGLCSTQYLKMDGKGKKKELLKTIGFDAIFIDESHQGSSTDKTKTDILDVDVDELRSCIKLNIFASGTSNKTKKYYGIHPSCVYEWEIEDEAYMKELFKSMHNKEIVDYMMKRHGSTFIECLEDKTLNQDYTKHPTQVLMKNSISTQIIDDIKEYNLKYKTNFGFNFSSLFALEQIINENGELEYINKFDICKTTDGESILKEVLDSIISSNRMRNTIMKEIELTQSVRGSRKSTTDHPLLFIVYLPTNTRNNTIALLQETLKRFLETHKLWDKYSIEYSNSISDTGNVKEEYNAFIKSIMTKTKEENKKGCMLLLGGKGSVGITYPECDVTISLDDGHNLDNQKQRFSRALTEAEGKTIGINVDMNIQRTYMILMDRIQTYRRITKTTKTNAEILYYLHEHNIFLFDPQQFNNGKIRSIDIMSYYESETTMMMLQIDDTYLLEQIECNDDMRDLIKIDFQTEIKQKQINKDLEGDQQDCPQGDVTKVQIDGPECKEKDSITKETEKDKEKEIVELINQTYEMCKQFLFPLLALISRSYHIFDFKEIFTNEKTKNLIISLLTDKKIDLHNYSLIVNIMHKIIDQNEEIVNNIREIYAIASAHKLRSLIEKHFIPTNDEKRKNAEVPTPIKLVDEMLDTIPLEFWKTIQPVFEPCCGKGNFVLGIFDKFYKGLEETYSDEIERCRVIMTKCIYYADITALNVFITTELMKCHVQSYCGLDELDFEFNNYTGDTLLLKMETQWDIHLEDVAIIGNPPYSTDPSKPDTKPLYDKFIEKYIGGKLLLFVVPSRWFIGGKGLDGFRDFMMKRKDIVYIQHEENSKKWFDNVDIEGGVNYFLKDTTYNGLCLFNKTLYDLSKYDCIINPNHHKLIDSVTNMESISKLYRGRCFGVETNDKRFKDIGEIKCYVSTLKSKDRCKYIDEYNFNEKNSFWKVITARANGKSPKFGAKFVGKPDEVHTGSYISFRVNNEDEAKSLISYLDTTFANHMLSIRKISQDISENTCKWIPLVPFDRIWDDKSVCEYLKIEQIMYM